MTQYKFLILAVISFFFLNADCNNGFRKTQRERCINGVQGFNPVQGKKNERGRWCISALVANQSARKDDTFLLLCLISEIELKKCDEKSDIFGINK